MNKIKFFGGKKMSVPVINSDLGQNLDWNIRK